MEKPIIPPVDKALLREEFARATEWPEASHGAIKLYCIDVGFPAILREIGRLREIAFRSGGGGTGEVLDLDRFDTDPYYRFRQLVVWDSEEEAIAGGYRFVYGYDVHLNGQGQPDIPSAHIFRFSENFIRDGLPRTMELSRSFIAAQYQRKLDAARKSIFILDCLFKGICIASRMGNTPDVFGKVTFYPDYPADAFALLTAAMEKHCYGGEDIAPVQAYTVPPSTETAQILTHDDFRSDFRALAATLLKRGQYLPPILKSYINLTTTLKYYGSALNDEFGNVVEMGLRLHMPDLNPDRWPLYFQ